MRLAILEPDPEARSATGVRGRAMATYLRGLGHVVEVLSTRPRDLETFERSRFSLRARLRRRWLRRPTLEHRYSFVADLMEPRLEDGRFDVIIARSQELGYVLTRRLPGHKILDLANIAFLEEYYVWGPNLAEVEETFTREQELLRAVSHVLIPHRQLVSVLLEAFSGVEGLDQKVVVARLGCERPARRASYSSSPRVVYAGSYQYIQDPYLLARLSARSPFPVDCFGARDPNRAFLPARLNYRGFAPNEDFLADYQFGLISVARDWLRMASPATKLPYYLSYGLPVLFPAWMQEGYEYPDCAIPFEEATFCDQLRAAAAPERWTRLSAAAAERAAALTWDTCLESLGSTIARGERGAPPLR